jgi:hypothetical protein
MVACHKMQMLMMKKKGMTVASIPIFVMLDTTKPWTSAQTAKNPASVDMILMETPALDNNFSTFHLSHDYLLSSQVHTWLS